MLWPLALHRPWKKRRRRVAVVVTAAAILVAACAPPVKDAQPLRFSAPDGAVLNEFYRQGPVAAHAVITPGHKPRLVVAFPAGNSGVAVWFDASGAPLQWQPNVNVEPVSQGALHGIRAELTATGGPITVRQAIASGVRVIRAFEDTGTVPPEVLSNPKVSERDVVWKRRRLDGAAGYSVSLEVLSGTIKGGTDRPVELTPAADGRLKLRLTALTGDAPLTPIDEKDLLTERAAPDAQLRNILTFLSYDEKLLAGSWRFNTYFGRDTQMSLRLLAPVLQPRVMEAGLASVLERLDAAGEVAHEEDIGEFAVLRHLQAGEPATDAPYFDYKMIDDDFMLSIVAAHYLLDMPMGRSRAAAFLARTTASGESYGARLASNLRFVVESSAPFARDPEWRNLIALKPGENAGNWRDSGDGLGGGRFPYDVNGVFVPAALAAIGRLHASGVLRPYSKPEIAMMMERASDSARIWQREAPRLFDVLIDTATAREAARDYGQRVGVDPSQAVSSLDGEQVRFRAVALDAQGRPIPVLNSDEAFALLFLDPEPEEARHIAETVTRPFPAGLLTDVGLVVANPAYAPEALERRFDRSHYHGTVIWSWQQGMFAAGLDRQLERADLPEDVRKSLERARDRLVAVSRAAQSIRGSELWSWSAEDGRYRLESFGQREQDETESNAAQLWSTVSLARPRE